MSKAPLRSLFLTLVLTLPTLSHAATPSLASSPAYRQAGINSRVQERLSQRLAAKKVKPTVRLASSNPVVGTQSLNMSSLSNLANDLLARMRSSSSSTSSVSTSSRSSVVSSQSSSRLSSSSSSSVSSRASSVSSRSSSSVRTSSASSVAQAPSGTLAQQVLSLLNQERSKAGLPALTSNSLLQNAAAGHAQDMNANNYFDHYGRNGSSPTERIRAAGYPDVPACNCNREFFYGENIARGQTTAAQVMNDWMNSPGHKANILSKNFREVGIAISGTYWVQDFGGVWDR
jgi:uncharacterized protein YkwD